MPGNDRKVVVVGASVAGLSAADTLREEGFEGSIIVLSDENEIPYDRPPLSKEALTGDVADLAVGRPLRSEEHFSDYKIDLRLGEGAIALRPEARCVHTSHGVVEYDDLIIASGCRARSLYTESGVPLPVVRTLQDARWLHGTARQARSAVMIGSGFIGLEVASSLRRLGLPVTVIGNKPQPLVHCVGSQVAGWVADLHRRHGVCLRMGVEVTAVSDGYGEYAVHLTDGTSVSADLVIVGIGVIHNTQWLEGSGVITDRGVICDSGGRTSLHNIYAAGDVAAYASPNGIGYQRIEHWTNAMEQGRHVALNLFHGEEKPFLTVPYAWSDQFDVKIQTLGRFQSGDVTAVVEGGFETDDFVALHGSESGFHAVTASTASPKLRAYRKMLRAGASFDDALKFAGG